MNYTIQNIYRLYNLKQ